MHYLTAPHEVQIDRKTGADFNARLISLWLSSNKSATTQRVYAADIAEFLKWVGDLPLYEVTYEDVQGYRQGLLDKGLAPRTINRKIHALRSLLTFGCEKVRMLPTNVAIVLGTEKVKNDLANRILDVEQVFRLFAQEQAYCKKAGHRNVLILRLFYYTGLRVSELCDLKWNDLRARSENEGQATVFGKGGKTRVVLIPQKVWPSLVATRGDAANDAPVFPSQKGGHLDPSQVYRIVRAAGVRAGIEGLSPHWLRHSHASHSMDGGAPLHVVQASLGHSNPATTGRYLHVRPGDGSGRYLG